MNQPDIPTAMSLFNNLSTDELKDILNDDIKFEELLKDCKQCKDLDAEKEIILATNRSLAEYNLSKESELVERREQVLKLAEEGQTLYSSIEDKIDTLKSSGDNMTSDLALDLLRQAAAEIEEESERIAENFLSGEIEIDEFLEQFDSRRKIMHIRKVKVDKMKELITKRSIYPASPNYMNTPINNFYTPSAVPYPTGPLNMPMPDMYRPF